MRFLNHMTFGQYIPTESLIHRLDPRCKILATTLLLTGIFLADHAVVYILWGVALIVLAGIHERSTIFFEAALLFAMFGFISTVAYCRFILRGDVIE